MFLGSANFGEAAHFVSTLGFFNLIFISFTPVILYFTKVEHWSSFAALPWGCLCGMAGLWLGKWTHILLLDVALDYHGGVITLGASILGFPSLCWLMSVYIWQILCRLLFD